MDYSVVMAGDLGNINLNYLLYVSSLSSSNLLSICVAIA